MSGKRQKALSKNKMVDWLDIDRDPEDFCDSNMLRNYKRNQQLVDLTFVPEEIENQILQEYQKLPTGDMKKVFDYFIKNKMILLMDELSEFKEANYEVSI